jgi:hypothetical protein
MFRLGKSSLNKVLWIVLLLFLVAIAVPLALQIRNKVHPDHLISQKGIPEILREIENEDVSCLVSCIGGNVKLTQEQQTTLSTCLEKFSRDANVEFYAPSAHKIAPYYTILFYEKQGDPEKPRATILLYVFEHMIEMSYDNEELVFTLENKGLLDLTTVIMSICPSPQDQSIIDSIRRSDESK